jgi:thymidylate synthase (FAD)
MTETPQDATTVSPVNLDEIELTPAVFRSDVKAVLMDSMGGEGSIVRRARVSTEGEGSIKIPTEVLEGSDLGLLRWLYSHKHGTPFEGVEFEWYFEVPIFVSRQIVKHRLSSINEESGRYREMKGEFWVEPEGRPMVQVGKTGDYVFEQGRPDQFEVMQTLEKMTAESAWENYQKALAYGLAKENARKILPFTLYTSMYFKANLRSMLNFCSLRKDWGPDATHPSKAQFEIAMLTDQIAEVIKEKVPNVWESFVKSGYEAV